MRFRSIKHVLDIQFSVRLSTIGALSFKDCKQLLLGPWTVSCERSDLEDQEPLVAATSVGVPAARRESYRQGMT